MILKRGNKSGQVTIFIILAILIVAGVGIYFIVKGKPETPKIPASIQPVEQTFLSCIEDYALSGIDILESQAGYIYVPEFEPGSEFMPFSSHLDFLGNEIPYWYYVSGNNAPREQVPTKELMEEQLEEFIEDKISECSLDEHSYAGYDISTGAPEAEVFIGERDVEVNLGMDLDIKFGEETSIIKTHKAVVPSSLGKLYDSAKKVYDYEQENLFLEEYAIDNLRLYAPVDGVEFSCSPLTWNAVEIFKELEEGIEINTLALRNSKKEKDYFGVELPVEEEIRFINSKNWAKTFEVQPADDALLIATPVGNQPGLGILGFCYVTYNFVYNVKYPVLIQVIEGDEIFQFPMAVIIQGNSPREPLDVGADEEEGAELCENKNTPVKVSVYDTDAAPLEADIFYECFGERCRIGKGSYIEENFPQCINGFVVAKAEGYRDSKILFSSAQEGSLSVYLSKTRELNVKLKLDSADYSGNAIITFNSDDFSKTISYPEQNKIELSDGLYEVEVYIYKDSSVETGAVTMEQCIDIPIGVFELTKKKCFDIEVPSQVISSALAGGGKTEYYILENELDSAGTIELDVGSLPAPTTLEQIQDNYVLFEDKEVEVAFK